MFRDTYKMAVPISTSWAMFGGAFKNGCPDFAWWRLLMILFSFGFGLVMHISSSIHWFRIFLLCSSISLFLIRFKTPKQFSFLKYWQLSPERESAQILSMRDIFSVTREIEATFKAIEKNTLEFGFRFHWVMSTYTFAVINLTRTAEEDCTCYDVIKSIDDHLKRATS